MFARVQSAAVLVLATLVVLATAIPGATPPKTVTVTNTATQTVTVTTTPGAPVGSICSTGELNCCNSVQASNSDLVGVLAGLLGVVLGPLDALVGVDCSPIEVIGIGGNSCTTQTVCCENNSFSGLIAIGCTPINISL